MCIIVVALPSRTPDSDPANEKQSPGLTLSQQIAIVNHTEAASSYSYYYYYGPENSLLNHSNDIDDTEDHTFVRETDPQYVPGAGPTDWASDVEVKKLGRRKHPPESSTNEVHSYHIDLSAYYASSQTVATTQHATLNLFAVIVTASLTVLCTAAH